ncbi:MAG: hypothetical protein JXA24_04230 [Proteobacteria bacterium]|nr:hypothetical protein [Pseudomonadota bacterium]
MKAIVASIFAAALVAALAAPAFAGQSYTNGQFKYSCTYPDNWKAKEESAKAELNSAEAAMMRGMGVEMPLMASACFGSKRCSPGDMGPDPQMHLMMMEVPKVKKGKAPADRPKAKAEKASRDKETNCEVIARGNKKWAGASVPYTTTRCEEKKRWRYNTTLTMLRNRGGKNYTYTFDCTMRSKSKDKGESMTEFNRELKPFCDASIASARFVK